MDVGHTNVRGGRWSALIWVLNSRCACEKKSAGTITYVEVLVVRVLGHVNGPLGGRQCGRFEQLNPVRINRRTFRQINKQNGRQTHTHPTHTNRRQLGYRGQVVRLHRLQLPQT
jgi:hypothetical protein